MNYFENDLTTLHAGLVNKQFSVVELVKETFATIKQREPQFEAFLALNEEAALKQAATLDEQGIAPDQLLAGIPVGIKDNIVTKGLTTTAASKIMENFNPIYDATVMEKLAEAGMINVGKLNLDEFAMGSSTETSAFKQTKNAWDQTKVPGGSSGGPAVAVAAGEIPVALGSDTGGSVRQPATFNGVVGTKPTYGRVSRYGLIAFSSSLDEIGPITRTVKDNALVLGAIAGHDDHDLTTSSKEVPDFTAGIEDGVKGLRIAVPKEYFAAGVADGVKDAIKQALAEMEKLGAVVDEVSLPYSKYGVPIYYVQACAEASSNLQRYDGIRYGFRAKDVKNLEDVYVRTRTEGFGPEVKRRIMLGTYVLAAGSYDKFFKKAAQVRTLVCRDFARVFKDHDVIMAPTTATPAFSFGAKVDDPVAMYMNDVLTIPSNLAGLPGMSVPAGFVDGMPVGLHIIANSFDEQTMYRAAYAYEQATRFFENVPAIGGQN